ncbi:MAG: alpha-amylase family glycosyl hydrolase [Bacteroidales bacterium]
MKKTILLLTNLFLVLTIAKGQMITSDPAVIMTGKVIKIIYDSSKDAGDLHNYTGDLYAHTGLILQGSTSWQKVIGTWAVNTTQPKLTYLGNFRYELTITPDIKAFYNVLAGEKVQKIALVLRNPTGSLQTRPDIFLDVFEAGLNSVFTLPQKQAFIIELNKTINISASATLADSITLYINNKYVKSGSTPDLVTHTITTTQYGEFWVKAIAWDKPSFAVDSFFFYVRKPVVTEALPAGLRDGINYTGATSATLVLHAPYKSYAFVTGDFTGWKASETGYMKRTPDGERYWLEVPGLTPKKEYRFQYLVDSTLIADPYCDKILDPDNDQYISAVTYPGLIKYPKDTTTGIVGVLQTSQTPYTWKTSSYTPPQKNKLVIHEMLVRDFTALHSFKAIRDTLNYLQKLGINAIELMPVNEFEGNLSWGYNPSYYFAPDKYYGTKNDFKALVDSCHRRGIAVIMDIVLNHAMGQSPLVQLYLDHYASDQIVMKTPNPWFNAMSPNQTYKWGADFNHESASTQAFVDRVTSYWMTEYKIDGFRFDFSKGFTNTPGDGSAYDASRIVILKRIADKIWEVNPNAYVILEHFAPNNEEKILAEYGMMPWGNVNYQYCEAVMGYPSDLTYATSAARGWLVQNLVSYMESHDEERVMYKAITFGSTGTNYNVKEIETALKRVELAEVFFLTIPGPKMLLQFGELGYDISIDFNGRTGEKPILWSYYTLQPRYRLYVVTSLLNKLKKEHEAFSTNDYTYSLAGKQKQILLNSTEMKVNILGNFDIGTAPVYPGFPQTGKWYEYFTGDSIIVSALNDPITFNPGEYRMYTTKRLSSPKKLLGIEDQYYLISKGLALAYPNPSHGDLALQFNEPLSTDCTYIINDLSGRRIKGGLIPRGTSLFDLNSSGPVINSLPGGVYLVRLNAGNRVQTIRFIKN